MRGLISIAGLFVLIVAAAVPAPAQEATPLADVEVGPAAAYCVEQGGIVRHRTPVYGTNGPELWQIELGGARDFCEFTGGEGADPPESWISISLDTLYSELPTLATLAYLTKPPLPGTSGGANPSAVYCAQLGGAYDFGGVGMAGGGWVTDDPAPALDVLNFCVFPDGSMIDAWGITYHAGGVIRGADLTPILRYQSPDPPHVFTGS